MLLVDSFKTIFFAGLNKMLNYFSILLLISLSLLNFPTFGSAPEEDFPQNSSKGRSSYWNSVMAGVIRGGTYVVEHPLVATMDRVALSGQSSTFVLKKLVREEGVMALWRGGSTVLARMGSWPLRMGTYQWVGKNVQSGYLKTFSSVVAMSAMDTLFLKPFDTLRIAMVSATKEKPFDIRRVLLLRVLYKDILTVGGGNLYTWTTYLSADAYYKNLFRSYSEEENLTSLQLVGVAGATTVISGVLCAPVRLVMTNLQAPEASCRGFIAGWRYTLKRIGMRGIIRHFRLGTVAYIPGNIAATFLFDWLDRKNSVAENHY
ncbi:MAG TPA: hypothetical protein DD412_08315 [Holosporales bacterium]|nr:hypothetical protein [Holosporales bacterium]